MPCVCPRIDAPAPSTGPSANPSPNAIPIRPIPAVRSRSGVMSAIYAIAVVMLAPKNPASIRDNRIQPKLGASAKITYDAVEPHRLSSRIGRRPYLSESRPQNGLHTICRTENDAISSATARPASSGGRYSAPIGPRIGMMIPNPSRSTNTVRKISRRGVSGCFMQAWVSPRAVRPGPSLSGGSGAPSIFAVHSAIGNGRWQTSNGKAGTQPPRLGRRPMRRGNGSFLQFDHEAPVLDVDGIHAVGERLPEARFVAELAHEVDVFQVAQPGVG
ncbi:MAG: hypothetical protein BWZ08_02744 [candidate division BRC1 bacterium ADurb.BinA292]|nr:MAG: hypothetical protein BWZ08_02744 [candidate division BRC1 bacterium ADurb.BinA292]